MEAKWLASYLPDNDCRKCRLYLDVNEEGAVIDIRFNFESYSQDDFQRLLDLKAFR